MMIAYFSVIIFINLAEIDSVNLISVVFKK